LFCKVIVIDLCDLAFRVISKTFDFRAQLECFSGSVDNSAYKKKVITVMDAFVNAHITDALHFRAGQYRFIVIIQRRKVAVRQ